MRIRLREPQVSRVEGGFLLMDPYGVFDRPLVLKEEGLLLLSFLDGKTVEEVQEEVFRAHGVLIPILVLAVDLSHVGPRFGDEPFSPSLAQRARAKDTLFLQALASEKPEEALAGLGENPTRIDAVEVVRLAQKTLPRGGKILAYQLDLEAPTLSAVGAATLAFTGDA